MAMGKVSSKMAQGKLFIFYCLYGNRVDSNNSYDRAIMDEPNVCGDVIIEQQYSGDNDKINSDVEH